MYLSPFQQGYPKPAVLTIGHKVAANPSIGLETWNSLQPGPWAPQIYIHL